ncbi:N-acetylmuramoyl-L-alanine amidase [Allomuricauda taeanensis]|uniref:N-acetylmuramoyl-L-alanine amidase family protein n=1 Tax=Flagellimonas taeanensis TaxID=1005926 RepID=UPI002E7BCA89|nr:N-acetylmuramoyl-L-alanine amidase [Allomuricauda taeanensis]MEE1963903.1 N-acetylmuramoyl-L-alanine amidase [Allomuricauda taeanensis]
MRNALSILFLITLVTHVLSFGQSASNPFVVVIDPGHGGDDSGAIGTHGILEKDIVLKVAQEMVRLNRETDGALGLYLTRYSDTLISLSDRTGLAKALKAEAYVSIHCNQAHRMEAQGIEVFLPMDTERFTEASLQLANAIGLNLNHYLGLKDRGVKAANFQVLRETVQVCPSILVELGFLSNGVEEEYFSKRTSIMAMALVLLETLNDFFDEGNSQ